MSEISKIDALVQVGRARGQVWSNPNIAVPEYMLVYDTDTRIIKQGDGVTLYHELPVYLDLNKIEDISTFYQAYFTPLSTGQAGNIIVINSTGTKITPSTYNLDDFITATDIELGSIDKADVDHVHTVEDITNVGTVFTTDTGILPNTIPVIGSNGKLDSNLFNATVTLSHNIEDMVAYLLCADFVRNDKDAQLLPDGYIDEFETESGIDTANSTAVYTAGYYSNDGSNPIELVSEMIETDTDPIAARVFLRLASGSIPNKETKVELSRDNGVTWVNTPLSNIALGNSSIEALVGNCNFASLEYTKTFTHADVILEDVKENISTFIVDTTNNNGHFNSAIDINYIKIGSIIYLGEDYTNPIIITDISGDGTAAQDITFTGIAASGDPIPVHTISNIALDDTLNTKFISVATSIQSIEFPMPSNLSYLCYVTMTAQAPIGFSFRFEDEVKVYTAGIWKTIVRLNDTVWEYLDDNEDWIMSPLNTCLSAVSEAVVHNVMDNTNVGNLNHEQFNIEPTSIIASFINNDGSPYLEELNIHGGISQAIPTGNNLKWKVTTTANTHIHGIRLRF